MELYPKISIVTPSFNDAKFLETTILSLLNQQYPNLEFIVMDGGSTDGSVEIIKKYETGLTCWVSEKDGGMYNALQKGFERSTGEIMGWINSDDMHQPGSLFTLAQIFSDFKKVNWLQGLPNGVDIHNRIVYATPRPEIDRFFFYNKKHISSHKYIQQESTFWRRSLWERAGSYISQQYKYAGDFELWMRFFQYEKLYNIRALLASFRLTDEDQFSLTNYSEYANETIQILAGYPLSKKEKRQLKYLNFFNAIEKRLINISNHGKNRFRVRSSSTINNQIRFDNQSQKFQMK